MKPRLTERRALAAIDATSKAFEVPAAAIVGKRRRPVIIPARQALCAALYRATATTMDELGHLIGGRHHTTVLHHIRQSEERERIDSDYAGCVVRIMDACK
jgi:chromosomal replication initiation ATPase DnaA